MKLVSGAIAFFFLVFQSLREDGGSLFYLFTNLTSLRKEYKSFHYGDYHEALVDQDVFSFVRDFDGEKG
jgi:glycosidase